MQTPFDISRLAFLPLMPGTTVNGLPYISASVHFKKLSSFTVFLSLIILHPPLPLPSPLPLPLHLPLPFTLPLPLPLALHFFDPLVFSELLLSLRSAPLWSQLPFMLRLFSEWLELTMLEQARPPQVSCTNAWRNVTMITHAQMSRASKPLTAANRAVVAKVTFRNFQQRRDRGAGVTTRRQ